MIINILLHFFLKNRIERTLKNKIMEWRSHLPTRWHRQCTSVLRQILPKLEFRNGHITREKEESYLEAFQEHYWVSVLLLLLKYSFRERASAKQHFTGYERLPLGKKYYLLYTHILLAHNK